MATCRIKELLLWMTLRTNEYEYIYKNRHRLSSQRRLGVTVTSTGHGWWEKEPPPLEIEDVAVIRRRTRTNTPHAINRRQIPQHALKAPALKKKKGSVYLLTTNELTRCLTDQKGIFKYPSSLISPFVEDVSAKWSFNIICGILSRWELWKRIYFNLENPQVFNC